MAWTLAGTFAGSEEKGARAKEEATWLYCRLYSIKECGKNMKELQKSLFEQCGQTWTS